MAEALDEPDPLTRARRFDELGLQHLDTRPGVGVINGTPDLLWRRVPAGSFWMGGDSLALNAWPGRQVDLPADIQMTAYPVTIAQFELFVEAGGYSEPWRSVWSRIGWDWKQRHSYGRAPVRIPNQPVQVTSYEADAFAGWLEALRRAGSLTVPVGVPAQHVIRLPDEAEREWASRYPDGRAFPWGSDYQIGAANIDETSYGERVGPYYLARITAVGIYPSGRQSALGIYDLSGNVDEWCLTAWDEAGYSAKNDPDTVGYRVVRGGHYHNGVSFARAASRTWGDPDPDDQYDPARGFRLVIGPPL